MLYYNSAPAAVRVAHGKGGQVDVADDQGLKGLQGLIGDPGV
ncbi:MAG TPA: hypothetical protein VI756_05060 [Blastocatellia bacterium]